MVALVIAFALVIPASVLAVQLGSRSAPAGGANLTVATDAAYTYDPMGDYAGVVGVLHASRASSRACFWVTATETSGAFGAGSFFLVFPAGYAATDDLTLLDGSGKAVASPGDSVNVPTTPQLLGSRADGCSSGPTLGALHVEREITQPLSTSTPTRATASGCAPTTATMPRGVSSATIADVDGDGRKDTEWVPFGARGGGLLFGITTASGATISDEQDFAGGGARSFVIGKLSSGIVVADAVARFVDVAPDGLHATLTDQTATVTRRIDDRTEPAEWDRYDGISCGASKVLIPVAKR